MVYEVDFLGFRKIERICWNIKVLNIEEFLIEYKYLIWDYLK